MPAEPGKVDGPDSGQGDRPDFLVDGWSGFFGRLIFIVSFLALMIILFVAMSGLWRPA